MATYVNMKNSDTHRSKHQVSIGFVKNIHDFLSKSLKFADTIFTKLQHPFWLENSAIFSKISEWLGYTGFLLTLSNFSSLRSKNLLGIGDILVTSISFILSTTNLALSFVGKWVLSVFEAIWGFGRLLPFFIGMLISKGDRAKEEKLFSLGIKEVVQNIQGGVISLAISGGLIGAGLLIPAIGVPLIIALAVPVIALALKPVIKKLFQSFIAPAAKTIFNDILVPTFTPIADTLKTSFASFKKGVASFFSSIVGDVSTPTPPNPGELPKIDGNSQQITESVATLENATAAISLVEKPLVVKGKLLPKSILNTEPSVQNGSTFSRTLTALSDKLNAFDQTVPEINKAPKEESFDYFRYVVKDKRPLSALLQDIVTHKREITQQTLQSTTFFDRMQYKKRMDKINVLRLLESFLIQWQRFSQSNESNQFGGNAILLEERDGIIQMIQFGQLADEREKVIKFFIEYLLENYPQAWISMLHRGKVETLIKESINWMKRPDEKAINERIEQYKEKYLNQPIPESLSFLSDLLNETKALLHQKISSCNVFGLKLTYSEIIDLGSKEKKDALLEKIEGYAVRTFPDFASSYQGRGERHAILRAIINNIYYHDTQPDVSKDLLDLTVDELPPMPVVRQA